MEMFFLNSDLFKHLRNSPIGSAFKWILSTALNMDTIAHVHLSLRKSEGVKKIEKKTHKIKTNSFY